jgi:hypothetical protein
MTNNPTYDPPLAPATEDEAKAAILPMVEALEPPPRIDMAELHKFYMQILKPYPAWAIDAVSTKFINGKVKGQNMNYLPRPPLLSQALEEEMKPVYDTLSRRRQWAAIKAENEDFHDKVVKTPESKARVAAMKRNFDIWHAENNPPRRLIR